MRPSSQTDSIDTPPPTLRAYIAAHYLRQLRWAMLWVILAAGVLWLVGQFGAQQDGTAYLKDVWASPYTRIAIPCFLLIAPLTFCLRSYLAMLDVRQGVGLPLRFISSAMCIMPALLVCTEVLLMLAPRHPQTGGIDPMYGILVGAVAIPCGILLGLLLKLRIRPVLLMR